MSAKNRESNRLYRFLDYTVSHLYINNYTQLVDITLLLKSRSDMLNLNGSKYGIRDEEKLCSLCNLHVAESTYHFIGVCPVFKEFRISSFGKIVLSELEVVSILNGQHETVWGNLLIYLKNSIKYRTFLINESF